MTIAVSICAGANEEIPEHGYGSDLMAIYFHYTNELKRKGVAIRQPPISHSWAMEMQIEDPDGHVLRFEQIPSGPLKTIILIFELKLFR